MTLAVAWPTDLQRFPHFALNVADILLQHVERITQIFDRRIQTHEIRGETDKVLIVTVDQVVHGRLQHLQIQAQILFQRLQRNSSSSMFGDELVHFIVGVSEIILVEGERRWTTGSEHRKMIMIIKSIFGFTRKKIIIDTDIVIPDDPYLGSCSGAGL